VRSCDVQVGCFGTYVLSLRVFVCAACTQLIIFTDDRTYVSLDLANTSSSLALIRPICRELSSSSPTCPYSFLPPAISLSSSHLRCHLPRIHPYPSPSLPANIIRLHHHRSSSPLCSPFGLRSNIVMIFPPSQGDEKNDVHMVRLRCPRSFPRVKRPLPALCLCL
jgi:hypothetical protein